MTSARHYWTIQQLEDDIKMNRREELELRLRHRSEFNPDDQYLRDANAAKMRAKASEEILAVKLQGKL